jgi:diguanylate cyclase (GGDEF)-like protein
VTSASSEKLVLLVDDDPQIRESLSRYLQRNNFSVITAGTGEEALDRVDSHPIDMIVSDINMPGMSGFALREKLRDDYRTQDILFVFLTARSQPSDQVRGFGQQIDDYLAKPIDPEVFLAHIESIFERRKRYASTNRNDALTCLLNRYWVEREIKSALIQQNRSDGVGSLVFLDVDDFKRVNDLYGHPMGDAVLVHLSFVMRNSLRASDIAGRYGGEEFLLYLVGTPKSQAVRFTEKLLQLFSELEFGGGEIRPGFSAGVVESPKDGTEFRTLCARSDKAMYRAKKLGKARVIPW